MRAGPSRARAEPILTGSPRPGSVVAKRFLNSLAIRAGLSILYGSGNDSIEGSIKKFKIFSLFNISFLIINKSHIFNNVHKFSLIFNKFFQDSQTFFKKLFFSFSNIFNKISLTIFIIFFFLQKNFFKFVLHLFKKLLKIPKKFVKSFIIYYNFC